MLVSTSFTIESSDGCVTRRAARKESRSSSRIKIFARGETWCTGKPCLIHRRTLLIEIECRVAAPRMSTVTTGGITGRHCMIRTLPKYGQACHESLKRGRFEMCGGWIQREVSDGANAGVSPIGHILFDSSSSF